MGDAAETVLLVDDSHSMRLLCRVNLELEGYRVLEASTLREAEDVLGAEPVDVVLLDIHVGEESGFELLPTIRRSDGAAVAVITGTAEVRASDHELVDAVIRKPFTLDELTTTVHRLAHG